MKQLTPLLLLLLPFLVTSQFDSLMHDDISRTYLTHLPSNYNGSEKLSLVIAMHGGFGSATNLQNQSQLSAKADEENFVVVYPEGVQGGVFNIRTWNAGWCCGHASASNVDDVGFIDTLLDTLIEKYSIDTNRIYATGMSNGGFMSYRLACELSDRIAAIAPVAASMTMTNCEPNRAVPVIDFHSYLDTNVRPEGGFGTGASSHYSPPLDSVLNVWNNLNACTNRNDTINNDSAYTHIIWSNCDCNYQVEQYITQDGGHSWPGGRATPLGDPVSNVINANDLMWDFFEKYALDCETTSNSEINKEAEPIIYPNPSNGVIHIDVDHKTSNLEVRIYDIMGHEKLVSEGRSTVNVSLLPKGVYVMKILVGDKNVTSKFMKI